MPVSAVYAVRLSVRVSVTSRHSIETVEQIERVRADLDVSYNAPILQESSGLSFWFVFLCWNSQLEGSIVRLNTVDKCV